MPVTSANAARSSSRFKRIALPLLGSIAAALGLIATLLLATSVGTKLPGSLPAGPAPAVELSAPASSATQPLPGAILG